MKSVEARDSRHSVTDRFKPFQPFKPFPEVSTVGTCETLNG